MCRPLAAKDKSKGSHGRQQKATTNYIKVKNEDGGRGKLWTEEMGNDRLGRGRKQLASRSIVFIII